MKIISLIFYLFILIILFYNLAALRSDCINSDDKKQTNDIDKRCIIIFVCALFFFCSLTIMKEDPDIKEFISKHSSYEILDSVDERDLKEYIYDTFSFNDLYGTDYIRKNYSPREIWDSYDLYEEIDPRRDGYYTLEEAYDILSEQYQ